MLLKEFIELLLEKDLDSEVVIFDSQYNGGDYIERDAEPLIMNSQTCVIITGKEWGYEHLIAIEFNIKES